MDEMRKTAFTSSLKKMIDRDVQPAKNWHEAEKILNRYADGIEHYRRAFEKIKDPVQRALVLHKEIDRSLDGMKKSPSFKEVKCKAGCAHCCHNPVIVNEEEAMLLLLASRENKITIDWERVVEQGKLEGLSDHEYFLKPKSLTRCVFLGDDNRCKVYEHRPAACRKYFVGSDPSACDDREGTQEVMVLADTQTELMASGMMDIDHSKVGLLPKMLSQALGSATLMQLMMNEPAHCNHCQKETETKEWDCIECGLSKGHPRWN